MVDQGTATWHRIAGHMLEDKDHAAVSRGHGLGYLALLSVVSHSRLMEIAMNALTWIIRHDGRELWSVTSAGMQM